MDGLLAARVVSMICLGLVTWIVGEDIMCGSDWENPAGSLQNRNYILKTPNIPWTPIVPWP